MTITPGGVLSEARNCSAEITAGPVGARRHLRLCVKLLPLRLCEYVNGLDGRFRPFALLPPEDAHQSEWNQVALDWKGTEGHGSEWALYGTDLALSDLALEHVRRMGVAFGLETNLGTFWMQPGGRNWLPAG